MEIENLVENQLSKNEVLNLFPRDEIEQIIINILSLIFHNTYVLTYN